MSVSTALAEVLRGGRAEFNRRYAEAQHRYPGLDAQAFNDYLSGPVDQLVTQVARSDAAAVAALVEAAYDIGLTLHAQRWIGPGARTKAGPTARTTWRNGAAISPRCPPTRW